MNEWAFAGRSLQFNLLLVDHPKCLNATDGGYLGVHSLITLTAVTRTQSMLMEKDTQCVLYVFVCHECVCMEDGTYFNGSCSQSPLVRAMAGKGCHGNHQTAAVWPLQLRGTGKRNRRGREQWPHASTKVCKGKNCNEPHIPKTSRQQTPSRLNCNDRKTWCCKMSILLKKAKNYTRWLQRCSGSGVIQSGS